MAPAAAVIDMAVRSIAGEADERFLGQTRRPKRYKWRGCNTKSFGGAWIPPDSQRFKEIEEHKSRDDFPRNMVNNINLFQVPLIKIKNPPPKETTPSYGRTTTCVGNQLFS